MRILDSHFSWGFINGFARDHSLRTHTHIICQDREHYKIIIAPKIDGERVRKPPPVQRAENTNTSLFGNTGSYLVSSEVVNKNNHMYRDSDRHLYAKQNQNTVFNQPIHSILLSTLCGWTRIGVISFNGCTI